MDLELSSSRRYRGGLILFMLVLDLNNAESSLVVVPGNQGSFFTAFVADFLMILWSQGFRAPDHHLNDGL